MATGSRSSNHPAPLNQVPSTHDDSIEPAPVQVHVQTAPAPGSSGTTPSAGVDQDLRRAEEGDAGVEAHSKETVFNDSQNRDDRQQPSYRERLRQTVMNNHHADDYWKKMYESNDFRPVGNGNEICIYSEYGQWMFGTPRSHVELTVVQNITLSSMIALGEAMQVNPRFFSAYVACSPESDARYYYSEKDGAVWCRAFCENIHHGAGPRFSGARLGSLEDYASVWFYWHVRDKGPRIVLVDVEEEDLGSGELHIEIWNYLRRFNGIHRRSHTVAETLKDWNHTTPSQWKNTTYLDSRSLTIFLAYWVAEDIKKGSKDFETSALDSGRVYPHDTGTFTVPYKLANTLDLWAWNTTALIAEAAMNRFSVTAIEKPTFYTFRSMNACRAHVVRTRAWLQQSLGENTTGVFAGSTLWYNAVKQGAKQGNSSCSKQNTTPIQPASAEGQPASTEHQSDSDSKPEDQRQQFLKRFQNLEKELQETLTLLTQAVAVIDSDANKKAATRGSLLALLAALYLPATVVTGIFGMNIKKITEDKGPDWRPVVGIFVVLFGLTVLIIGLFEAKARSRRSWSESYFG